MTDRTRPLAPCYALTLVAACCGVGFAAAASRRADVPVHKKPYVHVIELYDTAGKRIAAESPAPYSPRKTCGRCHEAHDYDVIAQGMHFDMGARKMADDFGRKIGRPWVLSRGMVGGYLPTFRRQYAKKRNRSAAEIDLTAFEFVQHCGVCHPGGGALEHDRDGRRYDQRMRDQPGLAETLDGDYHKARWDQTGVVEIDCLLCHAQWPYDYRRRAEQLRKLRYSAAATLGAGFATREEGGNGALQYDPRLFGPTGKLRLPIGPPRDQACLACHHFAAARGLRARDRRAWRDVHSVRGLRCVACHRGGIDHNFELGRRLHYSMQAGPAGVERTPAKRAGSQPAAKPSGQAAKAKTATKPDTRLPAILGSQRTTLEAIAERLEKRQRQPMSCRACHESGGLGAPAPRHVGLPRRHLDRIACVGCHAGPTYLGKGDEPLLTDPATSTPAMAALASPYPDQRPAWFISLFKTGGRIRVHNTQTVSWWGNRVGEQTLWPLFPREVAAAWRKVGSEIQDDDGDGMPEVNTKTEIALMGEALAGVLKGGRFKKIHPMFVDGPYARWSSEGKTHRFETEQTKPQSVALGHIVVAAAKALGAGGCTDCHGRDRFFFDGDRIIKAVDFYGRPRMRSMRRVLGHYPSSGVRYGAYREGFIKPYGLWLCPIAIALCLLHYVIFGPKRVRDERPGEEIQRFSVFERTVHLLQALGFVVLTLTGVGFILSSLWGAGVPAIWSSRAAQGIHLGAGLVFVVTSVLLIGRWIPAMVFKPYDRQWFRVAGNYLWMRGEAPAGRFDAGQKALFWFLVLLCVVLGGTGIIMAFFGDSMRRFLPKAYAFHDLATVLLIPTIIVHVYLNSICRPGTLRGAFAGAVSRAWAAAHHSKWLEEIGKAEATDTSGSSEPGAALNNQSSTRNAQ